MEISFDDYLTTRIGLGRYQYQSFIILSMIEFMAGFQEIFVGILVRILKTEWQISENKQVILNSIFYCGVMIGNSICSVLADMIGRRKILLISQSLTIFTILFNSFAENYTEILITLFFYGLLFGICMPISQVLISEIVPVKTRGRFIVLLQLIYIVGILYLTLCCVIFLDSFDSGNWRSLLRFNIIPGVLCLFGSLVYLRESPRLYVAQGDFENGFRELNFMGKTNNNEYEDIDEMEQQSIIKWQDSIMKEQFQNVRIMGLVSNNNTRISLTIWAIFMTFNIISTGVQTITPYIYADQDSSFFPAFLAYGSEIFAILLVVILIDLPRYGGRINCTIYGLLLLALVQICIYKWETQFIVYGLILQRFSIRIVWSCLNALPAESYSTAYRAMGVGAAQGLGKASGMISPYPMLIIYYYQHYLPFLICASMSVITLILVFTYPINATQQQLDRNSSVVNLTEETQSTKVTDYIQINGIPQ